VESEHAWLSLIKVSLQAGAIGTLLDSNHWFSGLSLKWTWQVSKCGFVLVSVLSISPGDRWLMVLSSEHEHSQKRCEEAPSARGLSLSLTAGSCPCTQLGLLTH
jgi:membrane protein implicated in regulation of membrane protease activity